MLTIYDQTFLLNRIKDVKIFRPEVISIIFIKSGSIELNINGHNVLINSPCIFFVSPRYLYELYNICRDVELYILSIQNQFKDYVNYNFNKFEIYKTIAVSQNYNISIPVDEFNSIWGVLKHINFLSYDKKNIRYKDEAILHAYSSIVYLMVGHLEKSMINKQDNNSYTRKESIVMSFIELAFKHFIQEKELKFYANKLFISIKYLSICVKDISGYPPSHILNQLLIDASCNRLSQSNNSISDVAYEMEFADQFSFSKFFKKNMGITPSEFRKKSTTIHTI